MRGPETTVLWKALDNSTALVLPLKWFRCTTVRGAEALGLFAAWNSCSKLYDIQSGGATIRRCEITVIRQNLRGITLPIGEYEHSIPAAQDSIRIVNHGLSCGIRVLP